MTHEQKLKKLIEYLTEFIGAETFRECNSDGGHWMFLEKLYELLDETKNRESKTNEGVQYGATTPPNEP